MARPLKKVQGVFEKNTGSGVWYIRYRLNGKLVRKMIGGREEAIEALRKVTSVRATGLGVVARSAKEFTLTHQEQQTTEIGKVTVAELCDEYLAFLNDPLNPEPLRDKLGPPQRLRLIKERFGSRAAEMVLGREIKEWLREVGRTGKANGTLNRLKSTFSAVYRHAKEHGRVDVNPARDTKQFTVALPVPRWLQPDEEVRLRAALQKWIDECPEHHALKKCYLQCHPHEVTIALGTGMRKGNQYRLRWEDVNLERRSIHLQTTKTGKPLFIPIIDDVHDALIAMQTIQETIDQLQSARDSKHERDRTRMKGDGRVFPISENREWWALALKQARIENFRWHDMRHTFASRLTAHGVGLKVVQEACGHKSMQTTNRYAHLDQAHLHQAMSLLNR